MSTIDKQIPDQKLIEAVAKGMAFNNVDVPYNCPIDRRLRRMRLANTIEKPLNMVDIAFVSVNMSDDIISVDNSNEQKLLVKCNGNLRPRVLKLLACPFVETCSMSNTGVLVSRKRAVEIIEKNNTLTPTA